MLDVRSDAVTAAFGSAAGKGLVNVSGTAREGYDGYFDGQWLNTASLEDAVSKAYNRLPAHGNFSTLYVGVPAAFCDFYADVNVTAIGEGTVVTGHMAEMSRRRGLEALRKSSDVIQHAAIAYRIDGREPVFDPVGMSGKSMETYNTYISCKPGFSAAIGRIASALGFEEAEYIPVMYAEALTLMDHSYRFGGEVLADLGFLECSLAGVRGEGLQGIHSFTGGTAVIAAELTDRLDIDFDAAQTLLGQINLSDEFEQVTFYSVPKDGDVLKYGAQQINEVVRGCLREIAYKMNGALSQVTDESTCRRIFATGDAFFNIRGAIKYLAKSMGRAITPLAPNVPGYDRPENSSLVSLMRQAQLKQSDKGFFSRIVNKLRRV